MAHVISVGPFTTDFKDQIEKVHNEMEKTIELDCAAGSARPDTYIDGILKDTILEGKAGEPISKFFGNWKWDFSKLATDEEWLKVREIVAPRIKKLYNDGCIRYGSW